MKTQRNWNLPTKILFGFICMIGSMNVEPSFADHDDRGGKHDNGRYEHRGRGYDRGRHVQQRRVFRSYGYRERVYVAPPVVYAPPQPPGVSIFFPPIFFRP